MRKINVVILTPETADIGGVLSSSLSFSIGFSIEDEAVDVARSAAQGVHCDADVRFWSTRGKQHNYGKADRLHID